MFAAWQTCKFVEAEVISQFKLKLIRPPTVKPKERNLYVCRTANVQVRGGGGYLTIKLKFIRRRRSIFVFLTHSEHEA